MVMRRERESPEALLFIGGRDVEEKTHALQWDADGCSWHLGWVAGRSTERTKLRSNRVSKKLTRLRSSTLLMPMIQTAKA